MRKGFLTSNLQFVTSVLVINILYPIKLIIVCAPVSTTGFFCRKQLLFVLFVLFKQQLANSQFFCRYFSDYSCCFAVVIAWFYGFMKLSKPCCNYIDMCGPSIIVYSLSEDQEVRTGSIIRMDV